MKHAPLKRRRPPLEAIPAAARQIWKTKADMLHTITDQHKTIIEQTRALALISDAGTRTTKNYVEHLNTQREIYELAGFRLKLILTIRRQLEERLWNSLLELLALEERNHGFGYSWQDIQPILNLRRLFE